MADLSKTIPAPFERGGPPPQMGECPLCETPHDMVRVHYYEPTVGRGADGVDRRPVWRIPECGCLVDGEKFNLRLHTVTTRSWMQVTRQRPKPTIALI